MARHAPIADAPRLANYGAVIFALVTGEEVEAVDVVEAMKAAGKSLADLDRDLARARRAAMAASQTIASGASPRRPRR